MSEAKVCALLCWYDESPTWLAACVASLHGVADHVVAVDGAYAIYPEARAASPIEQRLALVETAAAAGIPLTLHVPGEPWIGNEVEKRNASLAIAGAVCGWDRSWWLMVVDADMRVIADNGGLRARLAASPYNVASFALTERFDYLSAQPLAAAARDAVMMRETRIPVRWLYRADESLRYVGTHYCVRSANGWIGGTSTPLLPDENVTMELEFEHLTAFRDRGRRERQATYYGRRDELAIEQAPLEVIA